jgi:RNA polymerase sigma-70 factor (ECF subfamily)
MADEPLCALFLPALRGERPAESDHAALERTLADLVAEVRAAWPGVTVPEAAFLPYLGARVAAVDALARAHSADLYLACACGLGQPAAYAAFDALLGRETDAALAHVQVPGIDAEDIKQQLRQRLLIDDRGAGPRIVDFDGRGDLRGWVRVIALRDALQVKRGAGREVPMGDAHLLDLGGGDPELALLKTKYRAEFQTAFQQALAGLSSRERNLLRQSFQSHLSIDEIGALYQVHRATAARWLAKLRERLSADTRAALMERLGADPGELDSIMRLIQSHLDVSIHRYLE